MWRKVIRSDFTPVPNCKLPLPDETMRLEVPVKPADRSEELEEEMNTAVERKNPPKCEVCQDNEKKNCKEWASGVDLPEDLQRLVFKGN